MEIEIEKKIHHKYVIAPTKNQTIGSGKDVSARCVCRTAGRFAFIKTKLSEPSMPCCPHAVLQALVLVPATAAAPALLHLQQVETAEEEDEEHVGDDVRALTGTNTSAWYRSGTEKL